MQRNESIQFWRVIACLMVFMVHLGQRISLEGTIRTITDFGASGVYLFFCISGFLIANSYFLYGKDDLKLFIYKRLIKILPLYYTVILYYYIVDGWILCDVPEKMGGGWIRYLFLLNGIVPKTGVGFWDNLGATWTIPYFIFAYICIPLILKYIRKWSHAIILFVFSCVVSNSIDLFCGWLKVLEGMPYFVLGIILYFCIKEKKQRTTSMLLIVIALIYVILDKKDTCLISCFFVLLLLNTEEMRFGSNIIKKMIEIIDKYSYTIYLVHAIIFVHILDRVELGRLKESAIAIMGTMVLAVICHECVEKPVQEFFNNIIQNRVVQEN